jgi:uncharacterized protein YndB with AHSA1/START domain
MSALTHEFSHKLPATAQTVFAALTRADELRIWFTEHAEVEARLDGAYRFWGKHTYGTPARADATQKIVRFVEPVLLAYSWTVHGCPSEVSLALDTDPDNPAGVILNGRHSFAAAPAVGRAKEMLDDLWRLNCGNLQAYLKGGARALLPDYTDPSPVVRLSILIDAPRERVFRALLDPDVLNRWIASAAAVEPRVGGRYSYGWSYDVNGTRVEGGPTRILELVENEKLVTDWPDWRGDPGVPAQRITWLLESVGAKTRVTLTHAGFVRTVDISDYPFGWGAFLKGLALAADGKSAAPQLERSA